MKKNLTIETKGYDSEQDHQKDDSISNSKRQKSSPASAGSSPMLADPSKIREPVTAAIIHRVKPEEANDLSKSQQLSRQHLFMTS